MMKAARSPALVLAIFIFLTVSLFSAFADTSAGNGSSSLPASYDLRDVGGRSYVTPVKTQCVPDEWWNNVGLCWAFATFASFESSLLKQGITSDPTALSSNLSPWHMGNYVGYNNPIYVFNEGIIPGSNPPVPISYNSETSGWGGSGLFTIDYLSRGQGPVLEHRAPLPIDEMEAHAVLVPPEEELPIQYMLREGLVFSRDDFSDDGEYRSVIKEAVMELGPAAAGMYLGVGDFPGQIGPTFWRDGNFTDFYCDSDALVNRLIHLVAVVGWDDERPIGGAPGPGAWLIKDSVGTTEHDQGYFWISYYDTVFLKGESYAVVLVADDGRDYAWPRYQSHHGALSRSEEGNDWIYESDGYNDGGRDSWACARFTADANGLLKAAGIVTVNRNQEVTLRVYGRWDEGENRPGDLLLSDTVTVVEVGYHAIDLSQPVPVRAGEEFVFAAGFAAQTGGAAEPLVYVVDDDPSPLPERTYRASYDPVSGWSDWSDYASLHGGSVFYIQGIMDSLSSSSVASGDYNGDGRSEIAVFRPDSGLWAVKGLGRIYFGAAGDIPVSGDYDGDGITDVAVYRPVTGLWAVAGVTRMYFGAPADRPVPGDYDGDGTCDPAVFGRTSGRWVVRELTRVYFGASADTPVPSDFDGDGRAEIAVFREATGLWAVRGITRSYFGASGDLPVPGSYRWYGSNPKNIPFRSQPAVFRPSTGLWAVRGLTRYYFGTVTDTPLRGDFNGDSLDETGVFRDSDGLWAVRGISRLYFGQLGDLPVTR